VTIAFDTRKDAEPDGNWGEYIHIKGHTLNRPKWTKAYEFSKKHTVTFVLLDGSERKIDRGLDGFDTYDDFGDVIGEVLKSVLISARDDGLFDDLPKGDRCELGVEEAEGSYGWPYYEDRGKENLV
jgi:hypothetical protein